MLTLRNRDKVVLHEVEFGHRPRLPSQTGEGREFRPPEFVVQGFSHQEVFDQIDSQIDNLIAQGVALPVHVFYRAEHLETGVRLADGRDAYSVPVAILAGAIRALN